MSVTQPDILLVCKQAASPFLNYGSAGGSGYSVNQTVADASKYSFNPGAGPYLGYFASSINNTTSMPWLGPSGIAAPSASLVNINVAVAFRFDGGFDNGSCKFVMPSTATVDGNVNLTFDPPAGAGNFDLTISFVGDGGSTITQVFSALTFGTEYVLSASLDVSTPTAVVMKAKLNSGAVQNPTTPTQNFNTMHFEAGWPNIGRRFDFDKYFGFIGHLHWFAYQRNAAAWGDTDLANINSSPSTTIPGWPSAAPTPQAAPVTPSPGPGVQPRKATQFRAALRGFAAPAALLAATLQSTAALAGALSTQIPLGSTFSGNNAISASATTGIACATQAAGRAALTADLSTNVAYGASVAGQASLTAALTSGIACAAVVGSNTNVAASLTTSQASFSTVRPPGPGVRPFSNLQFIGAPRGFAPTAAALQAAVSGKNAVTAALSSGIPLASTMGGAWTISGTLASPAALAAQLSAVSALSAQASTGIPLQAVPSAVTTIAAALSSGIPLGSALAGVASFSAQFGLIPAALNAQLGAVASINSSLTTSVVIASALSGKAALSSAISSGIQLSAAPAANAALLGVLTTMNLGPAAILAANSTITGALTAQTQLSASLSMTARLSGTLTHGVLVTGPRWVIKLTPYGRRIRITFGS